jgi:type I restriction enzyme S subunit
LKLYEPVLKYQIKGSGIPHVEKDIFGLLPNLFPSLPEQHKIAEILETVDNAIERTDTIIEKYKRIKQGLMHDLLTRGVVENDELGVMNYELRDEKKHGFKDSPLGRIPEEWEVVELGEVANVKRGASPRPIDDPIYFSESGRGWIRILDVTSSSKYLMKTSQYLSPIGEQKSVKVESNELIMSICATIGKPVIVKIPTCIHDGLVVFKNLSSQIDVEYLFYYLTFNEKDIQEMRQIGTQGNLNSTLVSSFKFLLPPLPEQHSIAEMLSQMDQTIEKEQKYKQKLESIKQGLMEDLLTGKVRVNHLINEGMKNVQPA